MDWIQMSTKTVSTTVMKKEKALATRTPQCFNSRPAKADTSTHRSTNAIACEKFYGEEGVLTTAFGTKSH